MADMKEISANIASQFRGLNGRHPGQWPLIPRLMCGLAVFVAVIAIEWFALSDGQTDELDAGRQTEEKLRGDYKSKVAQANNLDGLKQQKVQVGEYVLTLEKALPSKSEMAQLLDDISHAGTGHNLTLDVFKPGNPLVKDYYAEQPIDIKVIGSYHDLAQFSSDIANLTRIVTLNNLSVTSGKDGVLTLDTVAKTFRYLDQDELQAKKGKGGKK